MIKNKLILILLLFFCLSGCATGLSRDAIWWPHATRSQALIDLAETEKQKLELERQRFLWEMRKHKNQKLKDQEP